MSDKIATFLEALIAKKMGYKIYGKTTNESVTDWNPDTQTMVSWKAITSGEWFIKEKEDQLAHIGEDFLKMRLVVKEIKISDKEISIIRVPEGQENTLSVGVNQSYPLSEHVKTIGFKIEKSKKTEFSFCPNCGESVTDITHQFCGWCGEKFKK